MYTRLAERAEPRNGSDTSGDRTRRKEVAYRSSQEKLAGVVPAASSMRREYLWRKKTRKRRSRFRGPK